MALALNLDTAAGAGGAVAFLAVGLLVLASRGGGATRVLLAATCLTYGLCYLVVNLTSFGTLGEVYFVWALHVFAILAALAFVLALARSLPERRRIALGALALVNVGLLVVMIATWDTEAALRAHGVSASQPTPVGGRWFVGYALAFALSTAFLLLTAAMALDPASLNPKGAALLGVAFATFGAINAFRFVPHGFTGGSPGALVVLAALFWLPRRRAPPTPARLAAMFTILGIAFAGQILFLVATRSGVAVGNDLGSNGVLRTAAALLVALAILRERVFGIEPPRLAVRRGPLAAGALALLFIVAQIAQNFFEAQYGLVMGGVVAGAFLFAASPIQGLIERAAAVGGARAGAAAGRERTAAATPGREEAYRNALRLALRDRILTDEEEVHLAHLSDELGLTHRRAREIRNELRREQGGR